MRKQYHFRPSDRGLLAWDVDRLVTLSAGLPLIEVSLTQIRELDEPFWFSAEGDIPTCRKVVEHARLIREVDLSFPIILSADGGVMDGMHRVCRALMDEQKTIRAVRFANDPEPDYIGVDADDLPYEADRCSYRQPGLRPS